MPGRAAVMEIADISPLAAGGIVRVDPGELRFLDRQALERR